MRLITVLNRCTEFKRFVIEESRFDEHGEIMVSLRSRKNSKGESSCCGQLSPTYDTAAEARLFEFIPFWGFPVFLVYRMRRVACKVCGRVVVEKVPWSTGKPHLTALIYRCFLAQWAKKLSWTEVARSFRTSWDKVYHSVKYVVEYGIAHRCLDQVTALGVDEIQYRKGYHFLTLVYQIDTRRRRLLWMGEKRTKKSLDDGFTEEATSDEAKDEPNDGPVAEIKEILESVGHNPNGTNVSGNNGAVTTPLESPSSSDPQAGTDATSSKPRAKASRAKAA